MPNPQVVCCPQGICSSKKGLSRARCLRMGFSEASQPSPARREKPRGGGEEKRRVATVTIQDNCGCVPPLWSTQDTHSRLPAPQPPPLLGGDPSLSLSCVGFFFPPGCAVGINNRSNCREFPSRQMGRNGGNLISVGSSRVGRRSLPTLG